MAWPLVLMGLGATAAGLRYGLRKNPKLLADFRLPNLPKMPAFQGRNTLTGFESPMSKSEAAQILNLKFSQVNSADAIRDSHRRLFIANHPDRGGSPLLATKVNEAKEVLSGRSSK